MSFFPPKLLEMRNRQLQAPTREVWSPTFASYLMVTPRTTLSMEVTTWVLSWAFAIQFLPAHLKDFQLEDAAFPWSRPCETPEPVASRPSTTVVTHRLFFKTGSYLLRSNFIVPESNLPLWTWYNRQQRADHKHNSEQTQQWTKPCGGFEKTHLFSLFFVWRLHLVMLSS